MKREALREPPIVEAVLDFAFEVESLQRPAMDSLLFHLLGTDKTPPEPVYGQEIEINLGEPESEESQPTATRKSSELRAVRGWDAERTQAILVKPKGVSLGRVKEYPGWEQFVAAGMALCHSFAEASGASRVSRVGVRYINGLEGAGVSFESARDALALPLPLLVPNVAANPGPFLLAQRFDVGSGFGANLNIGVASISAPTPDRPARDPDVVVDIDVFFVAPQGGLPLDDLHGTLGKLRDLKNDFFFNSVRSSFLERYR